MEAPRDCRFLFNGYNKIPSQHEKNIIWRVIKDVSVRIKKSKTIKNAKSLLLGGKDISKELLDQETHLINNNSLIVLDQEQETKPEENDQNRAPNLHNSTRLRIYIKIASRAKTVVVEAKGYHIVNDVKSEIRAIEGIESKDYSLFFGGKKVEDYRTLVSLGVKTESTLHAIFEPETLLSIRVKTPAGKVLNIEANALYTVRDLKTIVESFVGCPVSDCKAILAGKELDDAKSLAFHGIGESCSEVLELRSCWIQVFVRTWSGESVTLFVRRSNTVSEVKEKLFCKLGIPICRHGIVFSGKRLEDHRILSDYGVCKDSTLHIVLWHI